jgi:mRNA interferase RelE/StbE
LPEAHTVRFLPAAEKALTKIHPVSRQKLVLSAQALSHNPYPPTSKKIVSPREMFRIRVGQYRIVYTVHNDELIVLIVALGHRKNVYRGLSS